VPRQEPAGHAPARDSENYTWRYVFYINLPIGILCFLGLRFFLANTAGNANEKLDWFGFGTLSLAIGALQVLLDRGEQLDWFGSGEIIIEAIIAASAFYRRRNTLVSESVDSFLPCHHAVSILRSLRNLVRTHGGRWHRDVVI